MWRNTELKDDVVQQRIDEMETLLAVPLLSIDDRAVLINRYQNISHKLIEAAPKTAANPKSARCQSL